MPNDKLPALPPSTHNAEDHGNPDTWTDDNLIKRGGIILSARPEIHHIWDDNLKHHEVFIAAEACKLMNAQDIRIAELEREIREARQLMVSFAYGGKPIEAANLWMDRDDKRNAERKNACG
jgi:hypothetical protein